MAADGRVIQDSDDSDAEISDAATSIDPLQDTTSTHGPSANVGTSRMDYRETRTDNNVHDNQHWGSGSADRVELPVNFDSFPAAQSEDATQVSSSQMLREQLWLGGGVARSLESSNIDEVSSLPQIIESSCSGRPFSVISPNKTILKRQRKVSAIDGTCVATLDVEQKLKRRKLDGSDFSPEPWDNRSCIQESNLDLFAKSDTTLSPSGLLTGTWNDTYEANKSLIDAIAARSNEKQMSGGEQRPESKQSQEVVIADHTPTAHSGEETLNRSKSMPPEPDSPHDTEPMSSTAFARVRRANPEFDERQHQMPFDVSPDEPALPESVEINRSRTGTENERSSRNQMLESTDQDELDSGDFGGMHNEVYKPRPTRTRSKVMESVENVVPEAKPSYKTRSVSQELTSSDRDELDSEDYGGMPKELYKPRPSRSRSKPADLVFLDQDVTQGREPGLAVVIPREITSKEMHQIQQEEITEIQCEAGDEDMHEPDAPPGPGREMFNETNSTDNLKYQEIEIPVLEPPALERRGRLRKNLGENSRSTEEPHLTAQEQESPGRVDAPQSLTKKRGRPKKKTLESTPVEPTTIPESDDPFSEVNPSVAVNRREHLAEQDPNTQQKEKSADVDTQSLKDTENRPGIASHGSGIPPQEQTNVEIPPSQTRLETPKKPAPAEIQKGPDKHSPISIRNKIPFRVGLSKRAKIAPLLKVVRK
ncbi:hypothetical protein VTO42DRAFT_2919 [Malbranchea cinnamomea]